MSTVPFDTLKLADQLAAGGFTSEQAKTASAALSEALKDDIAKKIDIQHVEIKIDALANTIAQKLESLELRITVKLGALVVFALGALTAIFKFIHA